MQLFLTFLLFLSITGLSFAANEFELINKARQLNLASKKYWRILLYYKGSSIISSEEFFLAKDGDSNPQAELDATIKSIFSPPFDDNSTLCRLPARVKWLKYQLNLTDSDIPQAECKAFKKHLKYLNPKNVSILYTNQSFISPQSMFGHVGLKINRDNSDNIWSNGHVVSFAVGLDDIISSPAALIKAITGRFKGHFVLSGFDAYRENYNSLENRDVWEYSLGLTADELETLMYRIWELKYINANYHFFSINCASIIEYWLKAARPDIRLNNRLWTTPMDVIENAYKGGLLQSLVFYPADARKYKAIMSILDGDKKREVYRLARGLTDPNQTLANYPEQDAANIIAAAQIKNTINFLNREIEKKEYLDKFTNFIATAARSNNIAIPLPYNPLDAHKINRLDIQHGYNSHGGYSFIQYSPLYHDVSDNPMGYPENVNLRFCSSKITRYNNGNQFGFEFDLINIASFIPINDYIQKLSFTIDSGFKSYFKYTTPEKKETQFYLTGARGVSWKFSENINSFGMVKFAAETSNLRKKHYYAGTGVKSGFIIGDKKFYSAVAEFDYDYGYEGFYSDNSCLKLTQSFFITRNLSLKANGRRNLKSGASDVNGGFALYF